MSGGGGVSENPFLGNRHADVLSENPTDPDARGRLCEEVKNRAKGAFQQKDMPSAELLYGKAIELLEGTGKEESTLFSNRAMVRLNLSKVEGARDDANRAIKLDNNNVKAHFRKAQALVRLNDYDDAVKAAETGAALDPSNKAFPELIESAKAAKEKDAEDKKKLRSDAQDARVELHNASTARQPPKRDPHAPDRASDTADGGAGSGMRGYKKTADGKTTSYFHTDISDEAKELIAKQGYGKPQKIENPTQVPDAAEAKGGGSAWNQAGTYEEKNMMTWMEAELKSRLKTVNFALPNGAAGGIKISDVRDVKGEATISMSRGKRRRLLDISLVAEFEAKVGELSGKGHYVLQDLTGDASEDPEVETNVDTNTPQQVREVMEAYAKPGGQGLQPLLMQEIKKLVKEYAEK